MAKLLMITGDRNLAEGKHGAFYNTLEEFSKYWERIDIICPPAHSTNQKLDFFGNVFVHPSPKSLFLQPFWILNKGKEIFNKEKFDLVTVHEYAPFYNGIGARWLYKKIKVPYILEIHHIPGHPKSASLKESLYKLMTSLFIRFDSASAKAIRVVNQHQTPEFLIKSGVPKDKILYIPSFYIDLEMFKPLNSSKKYDLIFVGRLASNKGINLLLEAAGKLKNDIPNFKLLIVGDGPEKENIRSKIEDLKLDQNVLLHGWARDSQEIANLINESKALIVPSYNEGGPRVLLEAMACGVAVITTNVGIAADIVQDGENGFFVDWSSDDIAEKAKILLNNEGMQSKVAQAGRLLAQKFDRKSAIKNFADRIKEATL